jgi:tyrosine-protein phosphatase OCA1
MPSFFPPLNFGYVQDHLFRSAIPNEINYQFLQTLHLKTILILSPEAVDSQLYDVEPLTHS